MTLPDRTPSAAAHTLSTPEEHRRLDAEVALTLGWTAELIVRSPHDAFEEWRDPQGRRYGPNPPPYSSDIAAAWLVAEQWSITLNHAISFDWHCHVLRCEDGRWIEGHAAAPSAPEAICLAALAAAKAQTA